jgi:hypothetical protein
VTLKIAALTDTPAGEVTATTPLAALAGTVAEIDVLESTWKTAGMPLKVTFVAPRKPFPLMVTLVPTGPADGVKPLIVGSAMLAANRVA